ncbi:MAG TPA: ABC transporter ATP-binding protein [Mesorhizobium sp.]|jgi:putative spermidine/putrescine transport system ATP-binding protein/spermidine/putrescine transport system ATP-binding protein|nr:ABC transporter ATP-binding protein [Mesorhizobium sp.]
MTAVEIQGVSRHFGALRALDDVSMRFPEGSFTALLGPSGSGKTTLLRLIAGFDIPDAGRILFDGQSVETVPVERRGIGMMFQSYALFPNLDVAGNVGFGLWARRLPKAEIGRRVAQTLDLVRLSGLETRRPHQLSGGQRQRVALARAVAIQPRVLLLDEPLSALDKALRLDMQVELKRIQREIGITTIFVTHDQEEALTLSDRIGILREGRLVEEGRPEEIYGHPRTEFAATFLGDANILRGQAEGNAIRLADGTLIALAGPAEGPGPAAACAVRPERIRLVAATSPAPAGRLNRLAGRVEKRIFSGASRTYFVETVAGSLRALVQSGGEAPFGEGEAVILDWPPESTIAVLPDSGAADAAVPALP